MAAPNDKTQQETLDETKAENISEETPSPAEPEPKKKPKQAEAATEPKDKEEEDKKDKKDKPKNKPSTASSIYDALMALKPTMERVGEIHERAKTGQDRKNLVSAIK